MKQKLPYEPAKYEKADVISIQAVAEGVADEYQQKRALKWIINNASEVYEMHYLASDRDTSFALGRAFVGQQITKMINLSVAAVFKEGD